MFNNGDLVILNKRGLTDNEIIDPTIGLSKNTPYVVLESGEKYVLIQGHYGVFSTEHFLRIDSEFFQGIKVFKEGDKVIVDNTGVIGWESIDTVSTLIKDCVYTINVYSFNAPFVRLLGFRIDMHPNHFKKVEDGI